MMITSKINMDLAVRGVTPMLYASQGDTGRALEVTFFANGSPWNIPDGASVYITYRKRDGCSEKCLMLSDRSPVAICTGNTATITLPGQMLDVDGLVTASIVFVDDKDHQLATFPILVVVEKSLGAGLEDAEALTPDLYTQILSALALERARINNLSSLDEGSTTGDAELQDIRVGHDGTVYSTAGGAVRGQVQVLTDKLEVQKAEENPAVAFAVVSEVSSKPAFVIRNNGETEIPGLQLPEVSQLRSQVQTVDSKLDDLGAEKKPTVAFAVVSEDTGKPAFVIRNNGETEIPGLQLPEEIRFQKITVAEDTVGYFDKYDFVFVDETGKTNFYVKNGVLYCAGVEAKDIKSENLVKQLKRQLGHYRNDNFNSEINMFICYGQSWACGYDAKVISSEQRYDNLMLDTGIMDTYIKISEETAPDTFGYESSATSFIPLVEQQREESAASGAAGETPVTGQTDIVKQLIKDENGYGINDICYQLLGTAPGRGSAKLNHLKKGTVYYSRLIGQVERANNIAKQLNKRLVVQAFSWVQGKTDDTSTPYFQQLEQLRSDIDADVKAITNQTNSVKCITWGGFGTSNAPNEAQDVYERYVYPSEQYEHIVCAGSQYHLTNVAAKNLHLTSESNELMGAQFGIAYKRTILDSKKFVPLKPIKFVKSKNILYVQFAVPQMPIVIDTDRLAERTNYGFRLFDAAGNEKTIESVNVISPDTLKLVCADDIATTDYLTYANNQDASVWNYPSDCSGNLRDSQGDYITYETHNRIKHRMDNWCVPFGKTISDLEE